VPVAGVLLRELTAERGGRQERQPALAVYALHHPQPGKTMNFSRRHFLGQSTMLAAAPVIGGGSGRQHLALLGDSIFDNGAYVGGKPDVIAQVRSHLQQGWDASLHAVDGATTRDVPAQLARVPSGATHLVMSAGGNDALMQQHLLDTPVRSSAEALGMLAQAVAGFEASYRRAVAACLQRKLPLVICTIYNGNFPDPAHRQRVAFALAGFNDAIIRTAIDNKLRVLDLRFLCRLPEDYANAIEPSSIGGDKIARAIVQTVATTDARQPGALVLGS
jgi:hypothetical protein